jgi:hypothetical protein
MYKTIKKLAYIFGIAAFLFSTTGCSDLLDEVTELKTDRMFRPINFTSELNKTQVTLKWALVEDAVSYTLQISDDADFNNLIVNENLTSTVYIIELAGSTDYYARVKANSAVESESSKFNESLTFRTPSENIFAGYSTLMTALNTVSVSWLPNANATHLLVTAADETTQTIDISAEEKALGMKMLPSLANSTYKVQIYNGTIVRGSVNIVVEGDVYLAAGEDLPAAIAAAPADQVIVLEPGALYLMGSSTVRFDKNIKIRGLLPTNLPILAMTSGTPTATSNMLGFVDGSVLDFVKFENIDFTGYCDNSTEAIKIGYLFNNNVLTTVNTLSFVNCNLHNFGNTPMRLQGNKNQVIENVIFKNSTIWDIGFGSTYAIVNSNSADLINNITFDGCTVYNFKGSLVLRTGQTLNSINITNCTINQGMQDASSSRYLIDANNATFAEGIKIDKCIFGTSGGAVGANGVRNTTGTLLVTGSYYTNDYVDDPIAVVTSFSIKKFMTAFSGASTALWNDPVNGDFTLKATTFAGKGIAGDLRWY